jgi:hypothetical protein
MICASCPLRDASTIPSGLTPDVAAFFHPVVRTIQHLFERVPARRTSEHGRETLVHPADGSRDLRRRHVLGVARLTLHQIFLHFFELARLLLDHEYTASRTHDHEVCSPRIKNFIPLCPVDAAIEAVRIGQAAMQDAEHFVLPLRDAAHEPVIPAAGEYPGHASMPAASRYLP